MTPTVYPITSNYPGQLFIMPKPSGERLHEDIKHYCSLGADTLISLLDHSEIQAFSLQNEGGICADNKIEFINFPIADFGLPDREHFKALTRDVTNRLNSGKGVAVHCRAGIGRSGMLTCCVLAGFTGSAIGAIEMVTQARGVAVPDTQEQRAFIISIVQEIMD